MVYGVVRGVLSFAFYLRSCANKFLGIGLWLISLFCNLKCTVWGGSSISTTVQRKGILSYVNDDHTKANLYGSIFQNIFQLCGKFVAMDSIDWGMINNILVIWCPFVFMLFYIWWMDGLPGAHLLSNLSPTKFKTRRAKHIWCIFFFMLCCVVHFHVMLFRAWGFDLHFIYAAARIIS